MHNAENHQLFDYEQNVQLRYDHAYGDNDTLDDIYSMITPLGQYGEYHKSQICSVFIREILNNTQKELGRIRILDLGCGKGNTLRTILEMTSCPDNLYGIDLSNERIEYC